MSQKILPTFLIAIAILTFFFYVNPVYKDIQVLQEESKQFDEALDKSKKLQKIRDELLLKYNSLSSDDLDRLEKLLPDNVDNVRLVLDLDGIASAHGLSVRDVAISSTSEEESEEVTIVGPDSDLFNSIQLSFSVTSTYDDFLLFLRDLEESLRIVDIKELSFEAPNEESSFSEYDVSLETYWLK
jgi:Tfp pilus assembly protein PilO